MKFDVIIGNPPYQDGTQNGGQNKIYNQISKKSLKLLKNSGILAFLTPASVLKVSKRFSLVGQQGLKLVDFTVNDYFDVGVKIVLWIVDKNYNGDVVVKNKDETYTVSKNEVIYDYSEINRDFVKLYHALKTATNKPEKRMFSHNAVDMTLGRGRVLEKTNGFNYPIYTIDSNGNIKFIQYNKPQPKLHNKRKLVIPISKSFKEEFAIVDDKDFDMKHLAVEIENETEVDNIKSFIFSDAFKSHVEKWKQVDGYGWNYALMYLPPFDKTKHWTNKEVKEFLESFLNEQNKPNKRKN